MSKKGSYAVCRTCLNDSFSFSNIFKELLKGEYVYEILKDVCQLEVNTDDGLPEYVCFDCHKKLSEFHSFKLQTHEGNAALHQIKDDLENCEIKCELEDPLDVEEDESNMRNAAHLQVPSSHGRMSLGGRLNVPEGAAEEKPEDRPFQMNLRRVRNRLRDVRAQNSIFKVNESGGEVTKIEDCRTEIRIVSLTNLSGPSELYDKGTERYENTVNGFSEEGDFTACRSDVIPPANSVCKETRPAEEYDYSEEIIKLEPPIDRGVREIVDYEVEREDIITNFSEAVSHKACGNFNACTSSECGNLTSKEKCHSLDATSVKSEPLQENEPGVSPSNDESLCSQNEEENGIYLEPLVCDHCGKEFLDKKTLLKHAVMHFQHSDMGCSLGETVTPGGGRKRRKRAGGRDLKCGWCGKRFNYPSDLKIHEIKHTGEKPFACKFCPKKFSRNITLRNHQILHTREKPFACKKCDKRYCDKERLISHLKSHHSEGPFECDICEKKFKQLWYLRNHQKLHDKNRTGFRCNFCDKEFKCKYYLDVHISIHLGEERFKCRFCGKVLSTKAYLKTHELIHTREFPFNCDICNKGCATRTHFMYHEERHYNGGPHKCSQCPMSYVHECSLRRHVRNVHEVKPYRCDWCKKSFTCLADKRNHEKMHGKQRQQSPGKVANLSGPSELYDSGKERNENSVNGLSGEGDSNACSSDVIAHANSVYEETRPAEEYDYSEGISIKSEPPVDRDVREISDSEVKRQDVIPKFSEAVSHIACGDLVDKDIRETIDSEGELCEGDGEDIISNFSEAVSHKACGNFNACTSSECGNLTSKEKCHSLDATRVKSEPLQENEPGVSPSNDESLCSQNEEENGIYLEPLVCDHCGKEFLDKKTLLEHAVMHFQHSDMGCSLGKTIPPGGGRKRRKKAGGRDLKCGWCGKRFKYPSDLKIHVIKHTGEKPFACKFCPKKFSRNITLRNHQVLHTREKPFACKKCDKRYCDKERLISHLKSHHSEGPFECDICEKKFKQLWYLRNHQKLHDKNRTGFRCNFCDKVFKCKYYLDVHISIHLGEERFKCRFCGKVLTTKAYLKTHERIHTREFPFNCDICNKGCATRTHFMYHEERHYNGGPHKCSQCPMSYVHECSLRRHVRNVHEVKPYRCDWCKKSFTCLADKRNHEKMHGKQRQQSPGKAANLSGPSELYDSGKERNENSVNGLSGEGDSNACSSDVIAHANSIYEETRPAEEYDYSEGISMKSEPPVDVREISDSEVESEDVIPKFSEAVSHIACGDLVDKDIRETIDSEGELCKGDGEDFNSKISEGGSRKIGGKVNACISGECENLASKEKCHFLDATSIKSKPIQENEPVISPSNNNSLYSKNEVENGIDVDLLVCDHCGEEFLDKTALLEHLIVHFEHCDIGCSLGETVPPGGGRKRRKKAGGRDLKCGWCGKQFNYPSDLKIHEIKHTGEKPFACKFCPKKFSRNVSLRSHQILHTREKPFACKKCDKRYCDKERLISHLKSHHSEGPFECDICDKKFKQLWYLRNHQKLHDKNRTGFRCNFCDKVFKCKYYLDVHVSIHLGEERFKCRFCGKVLSTKAYLKTHELIHTREFPFNCDICNKGCVTRMQLMYHEERHYGEGPHKCGQCPMSYVHQCSLRRHVLRVHETKKPYRCNWCEKTFSCTANRKKHEIAYHR